MDRFDVLNKHHRAILARLVKAVDSKPKDLKSLLASWLWPGYGQAPMPENDELIGLAAHWYPPRMSLMVHISDFGLGRAEHRVVPLGQLEEYWQTKPDWVDVRWMHAPLGMGLTHSTVSRTTH